MRLLLTGATGFVGRTILLRCLRERLYREIICPVREPQKLQAQLAREGVTAPAGLRIVAAEAPRWDLRSVGPADHVVHCAGVLFSRRRQPYFEVNVDGTLRLLETLAGHPKVAVLSSQSAGGPTPPGRERRSITDQDRPRSWYGASKLLMEQKITEAHPQQPVILLRAPMVLGPGDTAALPLFKAARGAWWPKPGLRTKTFSWIDSEDLAEAILHWLRTDSAAPGVEKCHVASPGEITDAALIRMAGEVSLRGGILVRVPQPLLRLAALAARFSPAITRAVPSLTPDRAREIWPVRWVVDGAEFGRRHEWCGRGELRTTLRRSLDWYRRAGWL